jgi:hypothetical protein
MTMLIDAGNGTLFDLIEVRRATHSITGFVICAPKIR